MRISDSAPRRALRELAEWQIGAEPVERIVRRLQEKADRQAGKAQAHAERLEIRRLLAMSDRQREAYFLASNRQLLRMFAQSQPSG